MVVQPVMVNLPEELFERIQQTAEDTNRSLETVLLESLLLLFGETPSNGAALEASLSELADEQLWALVFRRLSWFDADRLCELTAVQGRTGLTRPEQTEMSELLERVDQNMLLRSKALLLLQQRGHDVARYLKAGG